MMHLQECEYHPWIWNATQWLWDTKPCYCITNYYVSSQTDDIHMIACWIVPLLHAIQQNRLTAIYFLQMFQQTGTWGCVWDTWWRHYFPRCWPFVRGIHRSTMNSFHKGQWLAALMFSLICAWINGCVNIREAGDLRRNRDHYDVTVMRCNHHGHASVNLCKVDLTSVLHLRRYVTCTLLPSIRRPLELYKNLQDKKYVKWLILCYHIFNVVIHLTLYV